MYLVRVRKRNHRRWRTLYGFANSARARFIVRLYRKIGYEAARVKVS